MRRKLQNTEKQFQSLGGPHKPETILKMKAAWERRKADREKYTAYTHAVSARMSSPEMLIALRNRIAKNIKNGNHNGKSSDTKPERAMKAFLDDHKIIYEHQYVLETNRGSWTFDFFLPEKNMFVEVDSQYYHTKSFEVANRDQMKERLATDMGYIVARVSDKNWHPEIIFQSLENIQLASHAL